MSNKTILQNHNEIISNNNISIDDLIEIINNLPEAGGEVVEPILQEKSVTPTTSNQTITPDTNYDGLSKVTINAVTSDIDSDIKDTNIRKGIDILGVTGTLEEGITPTGTLEITENGTYDVTNYASTNVNVAGSGGDDMAGSLADRTITDFYSNSCTAIGEYSFRECEKLKTLVAPNAKSVGTYAFYGCSALKSIVLPSVTAVATNSFREASILEVIDLPKLTAIPATTFYGCRGLKALILRSKTMVTLAATSAFTQCYRILGTKNSGYNPNGEKIGFIYVPRALIEDYKVATNWSTDTLVTQFRALEDYTVDGTITGEIDKSKI